MSSEIHACGITVSRRDGSLVRLFSTTEGECGETEQVRKKKELFPSFIPRSCPTAPHYSHECCTGKKGLLGHPRGRIGLSTWALPPSFCHTSSLLEASNLLSYFCLLVLLDSYSPYSYLGPCVIKFVLCHRCVAPPSSW